MTHTDISGTLLQHPLVTKAFAAASVWHGDQKRGSSFKKDVLAVSHALRVAEVLQQNIDDYDPVLVATGLLHDAVEDKKATLQNIADDISPEVSSLVDEVSLDTSIKGKIRRDMQVAAMPSMSLNARRVKVADSGVNLINLAFDPPEGWTLENKINYFLSRQKLIEKADIPDLKLKTFAEDSLKLAERMILVGVRDRIIENGGKFGPIEGDISHIIDKAKSDIALMPRLYDENNRPVQLHTDLDKSYEQAPAAQREISTLVRHLADTTGSTAILPNELKKRARADEVVNGRMGGDARYINDLARVALVCKDMDDVQYAMHSISQSYKNVVIYDRFETPPPTGYRDLRLVVRTDNSHFAEIQIHLESYWNAKKYKGDDLYHQIRDLGSNAGDTMTSEEKKLRRNLYTASRELYAEAGAMHGFTKLEPGAAKPEKYDAFKQKYHKNAPSIPAV